MKLNLYISRFCKRLLGFNESSVLKIQKSKMSTSSNTKRFKVYVTQPIPNEAMEILKSNDLDINLNEKTPLDRETLLKSVKGIDALFCTLNEKINSELLNIAGDQMIFFVLKIYVYLFV